MVPEMISSGARLGFLTSTLVSPPSMKLAKPASNRGSPDAGTW